jgi:amino acid transporter
MGVLGAAAIGIGGMVGGGIFAVLGTAVDLARGATPLAFVLAGGIALLTSYSYARLAVRHPGAGGTVVYIDRAFGIDRATGILNVLLWLSYLVTVALYASAFGAYGATFFGDAPPALEHALISLGIVLPAVLNLLGTDLLSKAETAVVALKLALLAIVIVAGWSHVDSARLAPGQWASPLALVAAGMVIFVAYEGFELIANTSEDVRDPQHTLPRALYGSVAFVLVLYVLVAVVTGGSLSLETIREAKDYALAAAARPSLGQVGFTLVAVSALLATFSAINATLYGNARLGYTLAKDGELPEVLEQKAWNKPVTGVLISAGLSLLLANLVDLTAIATIASAGFLAVFAVVNAANVKLEKSRRRSLVISGLGLVTCSAALVTLLVHTASDDAQALWIVAAMVGASVLFELVYPAVTNREIDL